VLQPIRGDVGVQLPLLAGSQVGGAALARILNQGFRLPGGVPLDPLKHHQQYHRIAGLIAHTDCHEYLMISTDSGLGV
jgi:hypothetical protein